MTTYYLCLAQHPNAASEDGNVTFIVLTDKHEEFVKRANAIVKIGDAEGPRDIDKDELSKAYGDPRVVDLYRRNVPMFVTYLTEEQILSATEPLHVV